MTFCHFNNTQMIFHNAWPIAMCRNRVFIMLCRSGEGIIIRGGHITVLKIVVSNISWDMTYTLSQAVRKKNSSSQYVFSIKMSIKKGSSTVWGCHQQNKLLRDKDLVTLALVEAVQSLYLFSNKLPIMGGIDFSQLREAKQFRHQSQEVFPLGSMDAPSKCDCYIRQYLSVNFGVRVVLETSHRSAKINEIHPVGTRKITAHPTAIWHEGIVGRKSAVWFKAALEEI